MNSFFDRGDYRLTRLALILTAAIYPLSTVPWRLAEWFGGAPLAWVSRVPGPGGPAIVDPPVRAGVEVRYSDEVVWTIADATAGQWLASLVPAALTSALLALGCVVAWQLATATQRGEPFTAAAVRRLRVVGVSLLAYGLVLPPLRGLLDFLILTPENGPGVSFALDLTTLLPFVIGTVVLVLAESFRVGNRLRSDVEGLV